MAKKCGSVRRFLGMCRSNLGSVKRTDINELHSMLGEQAAEAVDGIKNQIADLKIQLRVIETAWSNGDWEELVRIRVVRENLVRELRDLEKYYGLV